MTGDATCWFFSNGNRLVSPLLGPLTSALPFNKALSISTFFTRISPLWRSPHIFRFYLNHFYLIVLYSFLSFLKNSNLATSLLITFYLISVHPNYHPKSFCLEPIFYPAAYFCLYLFFYQLQKNILYFLSGFFLSISLAISLSYSAAPLLISLFIYWLIFPAKR